MTRGAAPDWRRIVWLASYPKSGNTWLRTLLANFLKRSRRPVPLNALPFGPALDGHRVGELAGVAADDCTEAEVDSLIPACWRAYLASSACGPESRLSKTHGAYVVNRAGEPLFPGDVTAGALYVVRNPLDVAVSAAFHFGESGCAESVARLSDAEARLGGGGKWHCRTRLLDWSGHVASWRTAPFPVLVVRYEDLVEDAAGELDRVLRFLGFKEVAKARLRRAVEQSAFGSLRQREVRGGFREKLPANAGFFFREGRVGSWRGTLSADEVCSVVRKHGATMTALGYDPAGALALASGCEAKLQHGWPPRPDQQVGRRTDQCD